MNTVLLSGIVGQDLTVRYTGSGKAVANGSIAVQSGYGDNKKTEWFNFVIWDEYGVAAAETLKKGSKTTLVGRLSTRKWKDKNDQERTTTEVVVSSYGVPLLAKSEPRDSQETAPATEEVGF